LYWSKNLTGKEVPKKKERDAKENSQHWRRRPKHSDSRAKEKI